MIKRNIPAFAAALIMTASLTTAEGFSMPAPSLSPAGAGMTSGMKDDVIREWENSGRHKEFAYAVELLDRGMFNRAEKIFTNLKETGIKADAEGYGILCEVKMKSIGYESRMLRYIDKHPYSVLIPPIRYQYAMNLFDVQEYEEAARQFEQIPVRQIRKSARPAYIFYKSYAQLEADKLDQAMEGFMQIDSLPESDLTAAARYIMGYLAYEREDFNEALKWFSASEGDSRFQEMSLYYIIECRFLQEDYDYVIEHGPELFGRVSESRKKPLARFISESYLVKGKASEAKEYFDYVHLRDSDDKTDKDWFYAGSLLYQLKDFDGAVNCFSKMTDRTDSLGQAANYHLGYSYLELHNKLAALESFKDASQQVCNTTIREDAFFNYAKLAFDLNHDTSVFYDYLKEYTDKKKGDRIYSYIAVAALIDRDYQAAIEAYDNIDDFDADMKDNYVKSNFLRASQLIEKGAYSSAVPYLRAIGFYTDKNKGIGLLSRYWLAESYYRSGDYTKAITTYTELYNLSAFFGRPEYDNILYGLAYSNFMVEKYPMAVRWFDEYLKRGSSENMVQYRKDALERKGDCLYITKNYKGAYEAYDQVINDYFNVNDIYPYYQSAISHGLAGNMKKKIALLEHVLKADPASKFYPDALYELGRSYVSQNDDNAAFECFKILSETAGNINFKAKANLEMGMICRNMGEINQAISFYKNVVENYEGNDYVEDALLAMEAVYKSTNQPEVYLAYIDAVGMSGMKTEEEKESMIFNSAEQIFVGGNYEKALVRLQNFLKTYPSSKDCHKAEYYIADSYKHLGQMEKAAEWYGKVMVGGKGSTLEFAVLNYAEISFGLENYSDAYDAYARLADETLLSNNKSTGRIGMMRSAFLMHDAGKTIDAADKVLRSAEEGSDLAREAIYCKGQSYFSTSRREEAMNLFRTLAEYPEDAYGAEASYLLIQDFYDQGNFEKVEEGVYAFSDSGTGELYWLAKSFIVLGDAFVEQGNFKQARATYESILNGYTTTGEKDDTIGNVKLRLHRLEKLAPDVFAE